MSLYPSLCSGVAFLLDAELRCKDEAAGTPDQRVYHLEET